MGDAGSRLAVVPTCSPVVTAVFVLNDNECNPGGYIYGPRLQTFNWLLLGSLLCHGCFLSDVVYGLDYGLVS